MVRGACDVIHNTNENLISLTSKLYKQGRGKAYIDYKYGSINEFQQRKYKESFSWTQKTLMIYLNYVFWAGYYNFKKSPHEFLIHLAKDFVSLVNTTRYRLLHKISSQINSKKDEGDRF